MMKIHKKVLVSVFVVGCIVLSGILINLNQSVDKEQKGIVSKEKQSLQFTIRPVKRVCELKEGCCELEIIAKFKNTGNEPILLVNPQSSVPDWFKGEEGETYDLRELFGKSEITALISRPDRQQILLLSISEIFETKGIVNEFYLTINPGESKEVIFSKFGHQYAMPYWSFYPANKEDYPSGNPITEPLFPLEGPYQINLTYKNVLSRAYIYDEKEKRGKIVPVWTGNLTSNTIEINCSKGELK